MKQKVRKAVKTSFLEITPFVAVMAACMLIGIAIGCVFAANCGVDTLSKIVGEDVRNFSQDGTWEYSFSKTFFNLVFFLAFTAFGVIAIPILVFAKGFILSLSVSSLIASFGKVGIVAALSVFGVQAAISIPCLVLLSAFAFEISRVFAFVIVPPKHRIAGKKPNFIYFLAFFGFSLILLLLTATLDAVITPKLLSLSLKAIL